MTFLLQDTNDDRRQRRIDNMRAGEVLLSQGKKDEAISKFQQAVSITQEVVDNSIEVSVNYTVLQFTSVYF